MDLALITHEGWYAIKEKKKQTKPNQKPISSCKDKDRDDFMELLIFSDESIVDLKCFSTKLCIVSVNNLEFLNEKILLI